MIWRRDPERPATTTSGFGERYDAVAAINGSYFNMGTLFPTTYVRDEGELEGKTTPVETFRVDGALCVKKKKLDVVPSDTTNYESNFKRYKDVLASGPVLILDGQVKADWPDDGFFFDRHPRSAMGTGGGYTYLIVIDGRFRGKAEGMTIPEVAEICRQLGCTEAINFDGGGSTALWIKSLGVISHPCDNRKWDGAGERVVPNAVVVR